MCETTRKQCQDIEHEYDRFRSKRFSSYFPSSALNLRQRAHSFNLRSTSISDPSPSNTSSPSTIFDLSSTAIYKSHLRDLKARIHALTTDCTLLTDQLQRSEEEKQHLIDRVNQLERQRRDDNYSLQTELNECRKLLEKYREHHRRATSERFNQSPERDLSLFDEVQNDTKSSSSVYEPTNYQLLFKPLYEKLKIDAN